MNVSAIQDLIHTVDRLRKPGGCPWDIEQTHQSLRSVLIEETAELLETIDADDSDHMREELGDVLLQVIFHAQIAAEEGRFDFEDVARDINDKLIRRHPHVFGDMVLNDTAAVLKKWEEIKADERKNGKARPVPTGVFKDLPPALPALQYAADLVGQSRKRAPSHAEAFLQQQGIGDMDSETLDEEEAGAMLFQLVTVCQQQGIDPESALRHYSSRFRGQIEDAANTGKIV
jgi:XTP/dITP diphosphohydrolase/tetrapyrrole methylase family protein/MazG family protein